MKRRQILQGAAALGASGVPGSLGWQAAWAAESASGGRTLPIPAVLSVTGKQPGKLTAIESTHDFGAGLDSPTLGYSQPYLGPVIRVNRGETATMSVTNETGSPVTTHWHGLHIEGEADGGPHSAIAPGKTWLAELRIDQPAATLWYHSHIHGQTGWQVYSGLAGMMIIDDPSAPPNGLPQTWGVDDIPLIVQDRAFNGERSLYYNNRGPALMHGFRAPNMMVNGIFRPRATVPAGLVRLRVLNGSNARIYFFSFEDGRTFHQVGSDGGLLARPVAMRSIQLAPGERAEILVDFSNGRDVRLMSGEDTNSPMGGMMGGGRQAAADFRPFEVMRFTVDGDLKAAVNSIPDRIAGAPAEPDWGKPRRTREFSLDMGMGMGMGRGMMGGRMGMGGLSINGESMAMDRINLQVPLGETELWRITTNQMAHPFHIHGTSFQVLSLDGRKMSFEQTGLKDVVLLEREAELLVRFSRKADKSFPYMYHCHILEHEDAGMMGQFTTG